MAIFCIDASEKEDFANWKKEHDAELLDKVADMILNLPKKYIDNFDYVACALILNGLEELKVDAERENYASEEITKIDKE